MKKRILLVEDNPELVITLTDSAGWLTKHFVAARPKLRSFATATM